MKNFLKILFSKYHDKKQYNTLENDYEALVHSMQSEAWEKDSTTKRIKAENKSLRKEKKEWKERALKAEEKLKKANL